MPRKPHEELSQLNGAEIVKPIIVSDQSVEPVVNQEFDKTIAEEAFMNEMVELTLLETADENAPPHLMLNVNNRTQPIFRGVPIMVRRMFVEVLARCKQTKYTQKIDPVEMDRREMVATTTFAYPFNMVDSNPRGQAWLRAVKAEAN